MFWRNRVTLLEIGVNMYWANFLHFYQPPNQQKDILERVVNESYYPLLQGFLDTPWALATFNINAVLLELWERDKHTRLIEILQELLARNQIELTGSAKYHAILPLLSDKEIRRQIELNTKTLKRFFPQIKLKGFFPPEMAYSDRLAKVVWQMGFEWIGAPQLAYGETPPKFNRVYKIKDLGMKIFFRDKRLSVLILSGYAHSWEALIEEIPDYFEPERYSITVMDAETFGHHRPGLEDFLFEIYRVSRTKSAKAFIPLKVSEIPHFFSSSQELLPRNSTWSNSEQDFWLDKNKTRVRENPYLLWRDPENAIHRLQWEFVDWVIQQVYEQNEPRRARLLLDEALSSDQFWWASAKPWWSLEMIEQGAYHLKQVIAALPKVSPIQRQQAEKFYRSILDLSFKWQRSGKIRQAHLQEGGGWRKIPFKERASEGEYKQFILEFEDEMWRAARRMEFEKAIKWRDAIVKLKKGTDVNDAFHVVDQLWAARGRIPKLKSWRSIPEAELSDLAKQAFDAYNREFKK